MVPGLAVFLAGQFLISTSRIWVTRIGVGLGLRRPPFDVATFAHGRPPGHRQRRGIFPRDTDGGPRPGLAPDLGAGPLSWRGNVRGRRVREDRRLSAPLRAPTLALAGRPSRAARGRARALNGAWLEQAATACSTPTRRSNGCRRGPLTSPRPRPSWTPAPRRSRCTSTTNTGARASPPRSTSPTARPRPPASRPGLATRLTRRESWGAQFLTFECWVFVIGLSVWIVLLDRLVERLRGQSHADRPGRRAETSRRLRGSTAGGSR